MAESRPCVLRLIDTLRVVEVHLPQREAGAAHEVAKSGKNTGEQLGVKGRASGKNRTASRWAPIIYTIRCTVGTNTYLHLDDGYKLPRIFAVYDMLVITAYRPRGADVNCVQVARANTRIQCRACDLGNAFLIQHNTRTCSPRDSRLVKDLSLLLAVVCADLDVYYSTVGRT